MHQPKKVLVENDRHRMAFDDYYALGARRKYQLLADKLGVSYSTVKNWSLSFGWKQRIAERDAEVHRQTSEKSISDAVADRELNMRMARNAKNKAFRGIMEGKTKLSGSDFAKFLKIELELKNPPDPARSAGANTLPSNVHFYIPDNGRGPKKTPPEVVPPDDGGSPKPNVPD